MWQGCKNKLKFYLCDEEGHKTETMVCPVYKQMVTKARDLVAGAIKPT